MYGVFYHVLKILVVKQGVYGDRAHEALLCTYHTKVLRMILLPNVHHLMYATLDGVCKHPPVTLRPFSAKAQPQSAGGCWVYAAQPHTMHL